MSKFHNHVFVFKNCLFLLWIICKSDLAFSATETMENFSTLKNDVTFDIIDEIKVLRKLLKPGHDSYLNGVFINTTIVSFSNMLM